MYVAYCLAVIMHMACSGGAKLNIHIFSKVPVNDAKKGINRRVGWNTGNFIETNQAYFVKRFGFIKK